MEDDVFIHLKEVGKKFVLYDSPLDNVIDLLRGERQRGLDHWALRGIDLKVGPGECLGIVGRNGAGKSTLLEIICGIRPPTLGTIEVKGRVAALLQLGAGFNPEFTGRENVHLAGSLYGLTSSQVDERFDDIAAFAGIGSYIDRPVREYSTGMYARLAFSVCVHVDADILIIDEILGVGDIRFQQQSMRFLRRFRRKGIVVFVSHDEAAVSALCERAIWLDRGQVRASGACRDVLYLYRRDAARLAQPGDSFVASQLDVSTETFPVQDRRDDRAFDPDDPPTSIGAGRIVKACMTREGSPLDTPLGGGDEVRLEVRFELSRHFEAPHIVFVLRNPLGQISFGGDSGPPPGPVAAPGETMMCAFTFIVPQLRTGGYVFELFLLDGESVLLDHAEEAQTIHILADRDREGIANPRMIETRLWLEPEEGAHER